MATDVERLVVSLEASISKYERTMQRALGQTNATAKRIESRFAGMSRQINSSFSGLQRGIATAFASVAAVRGAVQLVDAATRIENGLKVAGLAGEELAAVYDRLYDSAQRNAAPLETLAQLYGRVAIVQNELGTSTEEMLLFTENVALALRVAGTDAQTASGALLQLSQAMGAGIVRAEEFNSILEGALPIAQAAAAGLEEAGGSVARLRQLVVDGKVSSEAFFRAFEAGAYTLKEKVANAEVTVSQQFVRLQNVLIDVAREMNEGTSASRVLGEGVENLAFVVREMADFVQFAIGPVQTLIGLFESGASAANSFANEIARISGAEAIGAAAATWVNDRQIPGLNANSSAGGRVLSQTFELLGATAKDEALANALAGKAAPEPLRIVVEADEPRTVSLSDYKLPSGSGKGGGGGRGGKSAGERFGESLEDYQRRIDAMNAETELLRKLGPMVNDYGFAMEKLRATQELENAARRAGIALGPEQRAQIEGLASAYATATAEAERLAEAQNATVQQFGELRDAARSVLETIVDGFLEGKDAGDIFADVLKGIGSQLLNMGMNSLFGGGGSGGGFGLFGKLFGFSGGGYTGAGGVNEPAGVVHRGEKVWSQADIARAGGVARVEAMRKGISLPAIPQPRESGAGTSLTFAPTIDARGADIGVVDRIATLQQRQAAEFESRVKQIVRGRGTKWR